MPQGHIGTLIVEASRPATVTATLAGRPLPLFPEGGRWYGLVGVWAATKPSAWSLVVSALDAHGGAPVVEERVLRISARQFEIESIEMDDSTLGLVLDAEALAKENKLIAGLVSQRSPQRLWQGGFVQPVQGEVSSSYGLLRSYNGGPPTDQHGGLDLAADEGVPVAAANAGRVVLASPLKVRGNVVIIDHGWGLFTGYYHLSAVKVTADQYVEQGETIGLVGSTGFSTGPHLHWAVWVGGSLVDPVHILEWEMPG
ncbi:MAG: M23 family metallopeptidase [Anaerolineae bacterium]|nr:M23 family metallopeptidase [Anaerolineae bacterium]